MDLNQFNKVFLKVTNEHFKRNAPSTWSYAHGECMFYAYVVSKIFNGKAKSYICYKKNSGHCFVKIGKKYYDAECPEGKDNWRLLQKYLKNVSNIKNHRGTTAILKHWGHSDKIQEWNSVIIIIKSQISL